MSAGEASLRDLFGDQWTVGHPCEQEQGESVNDCTCRHHGTLKLPCKQKSFCFIDETKKNFIFVKKCSKSGWFILQSVKAAACTAPASRLFLIMRWFNM